MPLPELKFQLQTPEMRPATLPKVQTLHLDFSFSWKHPLDHPCLARETGTVFVAGHDLLCFRGSTYSHFQVGKCEKLMEHQPFRDAFVNGKPSVFFGFSTTLVYPVPLYLLLLPLYVGCWEQPYQYWLGLGRAAPAAATVVVAHRDLLKMGTGNGTRSCDTKTMYCWNINIYTYII